MKSDARIYVAGHRGMVGSAICRTLDHAGHKNLALRTRSELDLTDQSAVSQFFKQERPEYVFLAAARVGGIWANSFYPAEFIAQNLAIEANIIESACRNHAKRLIFLGSSCIYPKFAAQPIKEESLLSGPLEPTNRPYAVAKIAGIEMCWASNRQYHTKFLALMPTNLYGPGDNYDAQTSHVIPALIRNFHEAKVNQHKEAVVWGTGTPRREFLYSEDLADACVALMNLDEATFDSLLASASEPPLINVGCGQDQTIRELAELIANVVEYKGTLRFDSTKPDGTPRKLLDVSKLFALGWKPKTGLRAGLEIAYGEFLKTKRAAAAK